MNKTTVISSVNNPLIKEVKGLYRKKNRWESKSFIIEGIKIIEEALESKVELEYIFYSDTLVRNTHGRQLLDKISNRRNIINVTDKVFKEISDTENPQGVLGIVKFKEKNLNNIKNIDKPSLLFLDEIQDPGNIGTIIRSGDAFNIDGIILGKGCVDPYNPKVIRSTMGSIFRTPIYLCEDTLDCLKTIKSMNLNILATSLEGDPIYSKSFRKGFLCIIGNESRGVSKEILNIVDEEIKIPMAGEAESLNAGVAASIIMYEIMKSRT